MNTSLGTRFFLWARRTLTPYERMAAHLPKDGKILDLGCGHGLLSHVLASGEPGREVIGVDHDRERVSLARESSREIRNLRFEEGSLLDPPQGPAAGIALIDVMHYFTPEQQERILKQAAQALAPDGVLIVREVNPNAGAVSHWNRFYEKIATATGFTQAEKQPLHFRTPAQWEEALRQVGLQAFSEPCSHWLFADVLFIGRKPRQLPA